jgi:hypothetical protein
MTYLGRPKTHILIGLAGRFTRSLGPNGLLWRAIEQDSYRKEETYNEITQT